MQTNDYPVKEFTSNNNTVTKFVFDFNNAPAEAVLYQYKDRTVICLSVQSGCPVGCTFCGTGNKFLRNLERSEITYQVDYIVKEKKIIPYHGRFQLMFMSMGEPFLNFDEVDGAISSLFNQYPSAELLVSTIGVKGYGKWEHFIDVSHFLSNIGLQFSLHRSNDIEREKIIPYKNKMSVREIRNMGIEWHKYTHRPVFLNYFIEPGINDKETDVFSLKELFPPNVFNFTFSVVCNTDKNQTGQTPDYYKMVAMRSKFAEYNTRIFDPDGQDDIGGGCGQLWYVQDWMASLNEKK